MKPTRWIAGALMVLLVAGCVTVPPGPSVIVMPGSGKSFEQFQQDDAACRPWAQQQSGDAAASARQSTAAGAVIGTEVGAGLGARAGADMAIPYPVVVRNRSARVERRAMETVHDEAGWPGLITYSARRGLCRSRR